MDYPTNEQPREKYQELLRDINELKNSMGEMKKKLDQQMDLIRILRAYKIDALRPDYQNMDGKTKHMCYDDFRIKSHLINYESQLLGRNLQIPSFNQEDDLNEIHDKFFKSLDFYFDQMNMKMD